MLRYLFLDMNAFFASVEQQENAALRGRPVAVVPMLADTTCCIAASYEARAYGVKTGTQVRNARALCPELAIVPARPRVYVDYHHRIVGSVKECLPVDRVCSVDEMIFQLHGRERRRERAVEIAAELKKALRRDVGEAVRCSIGIAPNRFLAKTASDMEKPDGCTVLEMEDLPGALYRLEITDLCGIGRSMRKRLAARGITTVEQLCTARRGVLRMLWGGVVGDRMYAKLRGEDIDDPRTERKSVGHSCVLAPDLRNPEAAGAILSKLLQKAMRRLRSYEMLAGALHIKVRHLRAPSWKRDATITPTDATGTLLSHLATLWPEYPVCAETPPFAVSIVLSRLRPTAAGQLSLFDTAPSAAECNGHAGGALLNGAESQASRIDRALDMVMEKCGAGVLYYGGAHRVREAAPMRIPFNRVPNPALEEWEDDG